MTVGSSIASLSAITFVPYPDAARRKQSRSPRCYEGKGCWEDPRGRVLPPFDELIESGRIVGLNFPVTLNPALAKVIGTMMKIDYHRAVQLRIPKMDAEPHRYFRPTVLSFAKTRIRF